MVSFWPWGRDRSSPASFEKTLSALSTKITATQASLDETRASARRIKVLWVLYTGFAYLVYAVVQLVAVGYQNMGALEWGGMAGGPIFIILIRKLIGACFDFRTDLLSKRLRHQQEERAKTIQQLKDATKYDSTMELIEKYGGEKKKATEDQVNDGNQKQKHRQEHPNLGTQNRTRMPPPPTANIQRRSVSGAAATLAPDPAPSSFKTKPNDANALEPGAEFAANASSPHATPSQGYPSGGGGGGESHWYDRIFDVLLGEDETAPKNRLALICQSCRLVNGQAPPGTRSLSELGLWRCMGCHAQNGEMDEGKRIMQEVLASSSQQEKIDNDDDEDDDDDDDDDDAVVKQKLIVEQAVDEQSSATGVGIGEGSKRRSNKSNKK